MSAAKTNPVQIVLNSSNYVDFQEKTGGGGSKDFFQGDDAGFALHKEKLQSQLASIQAHISSPDVVPVAYVKVKLREKAVAKSHRPIQRLFRPDYCPAVGVDGIGEIYYRVSPSSISRVMGSASVAEVESQRKQNSTTGEWEFLPSRERSEVGAIQDISLPEESDKRSFSISDGIKWLEDERSGRLYVINLFHLPGTIGEMLKFPKEEAAAYADFILRLNALPFGVRLFRASLSGSDPFDFLLLRPVKRKPSLNLEDLFSPWDEKMADDIYSNDESSHKALMGLLSNHPLVRKISLPPLISSATSMGRPLLASSAAFPTRDAMRRYPKVGIVDSGLDSAFGDWLVGSSDFIAAIDRREVHGSFIAGLLVSARAAGNSPEVAREEDGCDLYDLDLFPNQFNVGAFGSYYPNGFEAFLQELDLSIAKAKRDHGVRVFNISLNIETQVDDSNYGPFPVMLDDIARKNDILIVMSAGNLSRFRGPWPGSSSQVAAYLLPHAGSDRLFQPSESVHVLTVGAINPPNVSGQIADAPAPYTRRGPGMKVGLKPDFCHYGGSEPAGGDSNKGLYSLQPDGRILSDLGTSYAAPLVAKTLASLDNSIEGHVQRETLLALLIHSASIPKPLRSPELGTIARHFAGFGLPSSSSDMLLGDDHSITMVFHSVLNAGKELSFDFAWPRSLATGEGKCRGEARMTLVYKPEIDAACGAEFVRVNLDAHLRQSDGKGGFDGQANQVFMKGSPKDAHFEADQIEHGLKWWPSKHYRMLSPKGRGRSSAWRLVVEPLLRAGTPFPAKGVPFTVILTIGDDKKTEPIFQEMRQWLGANSVQIGDIRTATRIRS